MAHLLMRRGQITAALRARKSRWTRLDPDRAMAGMNPGSPVFRNVFRFLKSNKHLQEQTVVAAVIRFAVDNLKRFRSICRMWRHGELGSFEPSIVVVPVLSTHHGFLGGRLTRSSMHRNVHAGANFRQGGIATLSADRLPRLSGHEFPAGEVRGLKRGTEDHEKEAAKPVGKQPLFQPLTPEPERFRSFRALGVQPSQLRDPKQRARYAAYLKSIA